MEPNDKNDEGSSSPNDQKPQRQYHQFRQTVDASNGTNDRINLSPWKVFRIVAQWPWPSFAVCTCIHLAFIGVTVGLYVTGYSILPVDFNKIPMIWNEDIASTRMRAWRERNSDGTTIPRYVLTKLRDRYYPRYTIELYYRARDGDVFTKRNLQTMQRIEHSLTNISEYQSKFCLLDENLNCTKPLSILRYFDGTYASANSALNDPNFDDIANVLFYADRSPETSELLQVFLARDALINKAFALSKYTRTIIPIGWPLTNTTDATARFEKYLIENIEPILLEIQRCHNSDTFLTFNYYSYELMQKDIHTAAMNDLKFVAGSFAFILVFIIIHTRSLWLSAVSIFGILSSFVITNVIYRVVFQFSYFGLFHVLSMFIILGIGADDVFIYYDTWRSSALQIYPSLAHRFCDVYKRAASSMFATSLTTMVAFFVSAFSPMLIVQTFGLFTGLLVLVNYLTVITLFPIAVLIYCIYFEKCRPTTAGASPPPEIEHVSPGDLFGQCSQGQIMHRNNAVLNDGNILDRSRSESDVSKVKSSAKTISIGLKELYPPQTRPNRRSVVTNHAVSPDSSTISDPDTDSNSSSKSQRSNSVSGTSVTKRCSNSCLLKQGNCWTRFLRGPFLRFITNTFSRYLVMGFFVTLVCIAVYQCTTIEVDSQHIEIFRKDNNYAIANRLRINGFRPNNFDSNVQINLVWGLKPRDMSTCDFRNIDDFKHCKGEYVSDDEFSISSGVNQMAMLELCNNLMNMTRKRITDLMIRIDSQTGKPEVQCFMYAIKDFMQKERQKAEYKSVPVTQPATPTLPPDLDPAIAALLQSGQVTPEMLRNYGYEEFIPYLSAAEAVNNNATINALQPFPKYPPDWNPDFPMTKDNMKVLIDNNPQIYTDPLDSNYTNWLEIALGYWITNGYTMTRTTDWFTYAGILGEEKFSYSLPVSLVNGQFYGTRLKYAAIVVNTTLDRRIVRYTDGLQYFQRWESFVNDMNANMPSGLNNAFFVVNGRNIYLHLKMGKSMVYQAIYGLCLGIALACPVLIMGTKNIIIGLMATFTILLSTTCVVGMIPVAGWKLGTMVSLNLCLVIGLSVDYTVHLAEGYAYAPYDDRKARTYFMFDEVGLPVTAGAVTTLGASLFMLFAEMQFLVQFGSFMFCTIGCSLLFSLTFLSTMMANIGPQRNEGNVTKWFSNCRNRKLNPQDRP